MGDHWQAEVADDGELFRLISKSNFNLADERISSSSNHVNVS